MRACGITSHFLFRMAKEQSASARPRGARSLLLSLHPLRVCHFCVKVHSLLSKFEPCKSENRVSQPLAPLRGSQTVRHSPYEIKNESCFLDASIRNQLSFFISHGSKLIHTLWCAGSSVIFQVVLKGFDRHKFPPRSRLFSDSRLAEHQNRIKSVVDIFCSSLFI